MDLLWGISHDQVLVGLCLHLGTIRKSYWGVASLRSRLLQNTSTYRRPRGFPSQVSILWCCCIPIDLHWKANGLTRLPCPWSRYYSKTNLSFFRSWLTCWDIQSSKSQHWVQPEKLYWQCIWLPKIFQIYQDLQGLWTCLFCCCFLSCYCFHWREYFGYVVMRSGTWNRRLSGKFLSAREYFKLWEFYNFWIAFISL
jgi:hypothetical protein